MRLWKKILLGFGAALLIVIALFVICIGPWPTYSSGFEGTGYYKNDLAAIDRNGNRFRLLLQQRLQCATERRMALESRLP